MPARKFAFSVRGDARYVPPSDICREITHRPTFDPGVRSSRLRS